MSDNFDNPLKRKLNLIDFNNFTVSALADGWVETDVSACTGTDTDKIWLINAYDLGANAVNVGARPTGSTKDTRIPAKLTTTVMTTVNSAGHVDLYRNAVSDIQYAFFGYLK